MKVVDFLDVPLNLDDSKSNHPPSILKNIPIAVNRRLSKISSNEQVFKDSVPPYQEALNKSGYSHTLKFEKISNSGAKKRNKVKISYRAMPNMKGVIGRHNTKVVKSTPE